MREPEHSRWRALYQGYGDFYHHEDTDEAATVVWAWTHDPEHEVAVLVVEDQHGSAESIIAVCDLPAYALALSAKGSVTFSTKRAQHYQDFLEIDGRFSHAHWLFQHNGDVLLPSWGKAEQWTLSGQHTDKYADCLLKSSESFARGSRG